VPRLDYLESEAGIALTAAGFLRFDWHIPDATIGSAIIIGRSLSDHREHGYNSAPAELWDKFPLTNLEQITDEHREIIAVLSDHEAEQGVEYATVEWWWGECKTCNSLFDNKDPKSLFPKLVRRWTLAEAYARGRNIVEKNRVLAEVKRVQKKLVI